MSAFRVNGAQHITARQVSQLPLSASSKFRQVWSISTPGYVPTFEVRLTSNSGYATGLLVSRLYEDTP